LGFFFFSAHLFFPSPKLWRLGGWERVKGGVAGEANPWRAPTHPAKLSQRRKSSFLQKTKSSDLWLAELRGLLGSRQLLSVPILRSDT